MILRYLAKTMLLPPMVQLLLIVLAWLLRKRLPRTSRVLFWVGLVSLWLLATPLVSTQLAKSLEWYPPLAPEILRDFQADAVVILAASQRNSALEFGEPVSGYVQLARIRYGALVAGKTGLPVLVSGGTVFGDDARSGAETMAHDLKSGFGVKVSWLENRSRTTAENASYSYAILAPEGKTRILLVTSAIHMARSVFSYEKAGFSVTAAPTMFVDRRPLTVLSFLPQAGSLELSSQAIHEWLGYLVYRLGK